MTAAGEDAVQRRRLAMSEAAPPEVLYFLAGISRADMVFPKGGNDFPFTESEMNTHLKISGAAP